MDDTIQNQITTTKKFMTIQKSYKQYNYLKRDSNILQENEKRNHDCLIHLLIWPDLMRLWRHFVRYPLFTYNVRMSGSEG